jgi:hypothetical protein
MRRSRPFPEGAPLFDAPDDAPRRSLKHHARSLSRLLNTQGLPQTARKDKARLLRKLQARLSEKSLQAREQRYAERYKAVRFFERQKAARRLRRAEKEAAAGAPGAAEEAQRCREDLAYATWFPRHLRYVALFAAKRSSADPKLAARRAALRVWALANAAAGAYLLQPPGAEAAGGDTDSEEGEEGVEGEGEGGEEEEGGAEGAEQKGAEEAPEPAPKRRATAAAAAAADPAPAAAAAAAADDFRLPARPAPPPARLRPGGPGAAAAAGDEVDELADGALPAGAGDGGVHAPLSGDTFFSSVPLGAHALPVFVEEARADGGGRGGDAPWEGGAWRSGGGDFGRRAVSGAPHAAARYEREHMHAPRYKDVAARRGEGAAGGARPPPPPAAAAAAGGPPRPQQWQQQQQQQQRRREREPPPPPAAAPDFSGLSDRKRRRAERALEHASRAAGGEARRFTESSFGTSADPFARLKSEDRLARAARKEAGAGGGGGGGEAGARWGGASRAGGGGSGQGGAAARGAPGARAGPAPPAPRTPRAEAPAPAPPPAAAGSAHGIARKDKKKSVLLRFEE